MNWTALGFDARGVGRNFQQAVVGTIRKLAGITIDQWSIIGGLRGPGSVSDKVPGVYRKYLFGTRTLQDLPTDPAEGPRFVFNATNIQSGALWRFSKPYAADWRVRTVRDRLLLLAAT